MLVPVCKFKFIEVQSAVNFMSVCHSGRAEYYDIQLHQPVAPAVLIDCSRERGHARYSLFGLVAGGEGPKQSTEPGTTQQQQQQQAPHWRQCLQLAI